MTRYVIESYAQGEAETLRAFANRVAQAILSLASRTPADAVQVEIGELAGMIRIRQARPGEPPPKEEWREEDEAPPDKRRGK